MITLNPEKCTGCGSCADICHESCIHISGQTACDSDTNIAARVRNVWQYALSRHCPGIITNQQAMITIGCLLLNSWMSYSNNADPSGDTGKIKLTVLC